MDNILALAFMVCVVLPVLYCIGVLIALGMIVVFVLAAVAAVVTLCYTLFSRV